VAERVDSGRAAGSSGENSDHCLASKVLLLLCVVSVTQVTSGQTERRFV
jgi:hypothetical protein